MYNRQADKVSELHIIQFTCWVTAAEGTINSQRQGAGIHNGFFVDYKFHFREYNRTCVQGAVMMLTLGRRIHAGADTGNYGAPIIC